MPLVEFWKLEGRKLLPLLRPGERVLALTATGVSPTREAELVDEPGPPPPAPTARERLEDVVDRALTGSLIHPKHADKAFAAPAYGRASSLAVRLLAEIRAPENAVRELRLAVTDARVLLLAVDGDGLDAPLRVVADLPRTVISAADVRSNLLRLSFARLHVDFRDGSWIEFTAAPAMGRAKARQAADAITTGASSVEGEPGG